MADLHVKEIEVWTPGVRQLMLREMPSEKALPNLDVAQAEAIARAKHHADSLCKGFGATTIYRFKSARPEAQEWDCAKVGKGFSCGFEGQAICELEERSTKVEETWGR